MTEKVKKCIEQAQRFLALREHNQTELQNKLSQKGYTETEIAETVKFLTDMDYLNEERFIRAFVRANNRFHPEGKYKVLQRLVLKGTDKEQAETILDEIYTDDYNHECLSRAFEKYSNKTKGSNKLFAKILSCGFRSSDIKALLIKKDFR